MTAFQLDVLYTVGKAEDPHGLEIKARLEDYYGYDVNHGRLYPNLDTLADEGLLKKSEKDKRTNKYELTAQAHRELDNRREWESLPNISSAE